MSGNILIHSSANRLNSYIILEYAEGRDSFYTTMLVDLTQPTDKVTLPHVVVSSEDQFSGGTNL